MATESAVTDTCTGAASGFNPILAAVGHNQTAGVISGVIFAGIVLLIGEHRAGLGKSMAGEQSRESRNVALLALVPAFIGMLLTSFAFASIAGETSCRRAAFGTVAIALTYGITATGIVYALAYLLQVKEGFSSTVETSATLGVFLIGGVVLAEMGVTILDVSQKYDRNLGLEFSIYAYIAVGLIGSTVLARRWLKGALPRFAARHVALVMYGPVGAGLVLLNLVTNVDPADYVGAAAPFPAQFVCIVMPLLALPALAILLMSLPARAMPAAQLPHGVPDDAATDEAQSPPSVEPVDLSRLNEAVRGAVAEL